MNKLFTIEMPYGSDEFLLIPLQYGDGTLALRGDSSEGPETFSVNLGQYNLTPPSGRHFYCKDYAEMTGVANALVRAGVAEKVSPVEIGPFRSQCWLMKLADDVLPDVKA